MNVRRSNHRLSSAPLLVGTPPSGERKVLDEEAFQKMISLERKRTERSRKPFLLMLLDVGDNWSPDKNGSLLVDVLNGLLSVTRETDAIGWYKTNSVAGVMFTEITVEDKNSLLSTMFARVSSLLQGRLSLEQFNQVYVSFHLFPEEWGDETPPRPSNPIFYPDVRNREKAHRVFGITKRAIDIIGSVAALIAFAPLFAMIAVLIKLTSKGPVIFRQERLGQFGKTFVCLKFRSMRVDNDLTIHREFMKRVIKGAYEGKADENGKAVYKMKDDPRVTRIGRILRRTSLDELPQFINVLKGDMSLVGPRPPLAYEYREYEIWHRRRVLEVKPGITGLWQIKGRSRVRFDDMVRLDLQYVRNCSFWLDLSILLQTPRAVFFGDGAF